MPKKPATQLKAPTTAQPEISIDDIFASKPKKLPKAPAQASTNAIASSSKSTFSTVVARTLDGEPPKKKSKKSKGGSIPVFVPKPEKSDVKRQASTLKGEESGSKRVVQEVLDPSISRPSEAVKVSNLKNGKDGGISAVAKAGKKKRKEQVEDDELFADSRGIGPRRKTEEGFLIYKEAELQIDPEAGGTPLCPFDCDCCF